jgi:hypothetical protein
MTNKTTPIPAADQRYRRAPVRVKLSRADAYLPQTYPPDGESENWQRRLRGTFATMSADFVDGRLMRAYAMQMEVLRRLRTGGQQVVRVEHVHISDAGRAVIGNLRTTDSEG